MCINIQKDKLVDFDTIRIEIKYRYKGWYYGMVDLVRSEEYND